MIKTHTINKDMSEIIRRKELAEFLIARRSRIKPEDVGLSSSGRRRVNGLRREEVAQLAGVSLSWYTWLEQGRNIRVSDQVLECLVAALRLNWTEKRHLYSLAREDHFEKMSLQVEDIERIPKSLQLLLDTLKDSPAYILDAYWNIVGGNSLAHKVFDEFSDFSPPHRNLIWIMFTSTQQRDFLENWEEEAKRCLATFRSSTHHYVSEIGFQYLIEELRHVSSHFDEWWEDFDLVIPKTKIKRFRHSKYGKLSFQMTVLTFPDYPHLSLVTYIAIDDSTKEKLKKYSN